MDMKANEILKKHITGYRGNIKQSDAVRAMEEYSNQKLVEFIKWYNETNNIGQHISNSRIVQFNLSQNEKDKGDI